MYDEISALVGTADDAKSIRAEGVTSCRGMAVNSGRTIVSLLVCFGDSYVLSAVYG